MRPLLSLQFIDPVQRTISIASIVPRTFAALPVNGEPSPLSQPWKRCRVGSAITSEKVECILGLLRFP
jgi:hypothetical protein